MLQQNIASVKRGGLAEANAKPFHPHGLKAQRLYGLFL